MEATQARSQAAAADTSPTLPAKVTVTPAGRFAAAVVAVLTSASYPLAGHVRDELRDSATALAEVGQSAKEGVAPAEFDAEAFTADLHAKIAADLDEKNASLAAAVASALADIKAAGDAQVAAVKAASTPK